METEIAETGLSLDGGLSLLGILLLLLLSGFFSGSETALTAVSRGRMRRMADQGSAKARQVVALTDDAERLIGSILLGNNLVNILATSLATSLFLSLFGESGVALATLVMTVMVLVFAEVAPKTYAISNPDKAALRVARPIALLVRVLNPIVSAVRRFVNYGLSLLGVQAEKDAKILTHEAHEEIRGAIDMHHSEGAVVKADRDMLLAALDLKDREVAEVMRHRRNIVMLNASDPTEAILRAALDSPYTRIPLWRDEPENIIGVLHAKDLLRAVERAVRGAGGDGGGVEAVNAIDVVELAMEPWFTPDTTSLDDQLKAFLKRNTHFALVVDEYGVLQGLVTLEDILEEIVGEIADEFDEEAEGVVRETDGAYIVEGGATIRDLNRHFDWRLPDDEATTIAGLVIHEAQMIPEAGQKFSFHGFRFEVLERKRHQITKLRVRAPRKAS